MLYVRRYAAATVADEDTVRVVHAPTPEPAREMANHFQDTYGNAYLCECLLTEIPGPEGKSAEGYPLMGWRYRNLNDGDLPFEVFKQIQIQLSEWLHNVIQHSDMRDMAAFGHSYASETAYPASLRSRELRETVTGDPDHNKP